MTADDVHKTDQLESWIAQGYDVIFSIRFFAFDLNADNAWVTKKGAVDDGGHCMLMVGYNRTKQYFIVRNQWGYDKADNGYTRISYEYSRNHAYRGVIVTGVSPEPLMDMNASSARLYLGRWQITIGQDQATLDLYRLPGLLSTTDLSDTQDNRVGTFFDGDGSVYRVNGYLSGGKLVFYINPDDDNPSYDRLDGIRFVAQLSADTKAVTGTASNGGHNTPFQASK